MIRRHQGVATECVGIGDVLDLQQRIAELERRCERQADEIGALERSHLEHETTEDLLRGQVEGKKRAVGYLRETLYGDLTALRRHADQNTTKQAPGKGSSDSAPAEARPHLVPGAETLRREMPQPEDFKAFTYLDAFKLVEGDSQSFEELLTTAKSELREELRRAHEVSLQSLYRRLAAMSVQLKETEGAYLGARREVQGLHLEMQRRDERMQRQVAEEIEAAREMQAGAAEDARREFQLKHEEMEEAMRERIRRYDDMMEEAETEQDAHKNALTAAEGRIAAAGKDMAAVREQLAQARAEIGRYVEQQKLAASDLDKVNAELKRREDAAVQADATLLGLRRRIRELEGEQAAAQEATTKVLQAQAQLRQVQRQNKELQDQVDAARLFREGLEEQNRQAAVDLEEANRNLTDQSAVSMALQGEMDRQLDDVTRAESTMADKDKLIETLRLQLASSQALAQQSNGHCEELEDATAQLQRRAQMISERSRLGAHFSALASAQGETLLGFVDRIHASASDTESAVAWERAAHGISQMIGLADAAAASMVSTRSADAAAIYDGCEPIDTIVRIEYAPKTQSTAVRTVPGFSEKFYSKWLEIAFGPFTSADAIHANQVRAAVESEANAAMERLQLERKAASSTRSARGKGTAHSTPKKDKPSTSSPTTPRLGPDGNAVHSRSPPTVHLEPVAEEMPPTKSRPGSAKNSKKSPASSRSSRPPSASAGGSRTPNDRKSVTSLHTSGSRGRGGSSPNLSPQRKSLLSGGAPQSVPCASVSVQCTLLTPLIATMGTSSTSSARGGRPSDDGFLNGLQAADGPDVAVPHDVDNSVTRVGDERSSFSVGTHHETESIFVSGRRPSDSATSIVTDGQASDDPRGDHMLGVEALRTSGTSDIFAPYRPVSPDAAMLRNAIAQQAMHDNVSASDRPPRTDRGTGSSRPSSARPPPATPATLQSSASVSSSQSPSSRSSTTDAALRPSSAQSVRSVKPLQASHPLSREASTRSVPVAAGSASTVFLSTVGTQTDAPRAEVSGAISSHREEVSMNSRTGASSLLRSPVNESCAASEAVDFASPDRFFHDTSVRRASPHGRPATVSSSSRSCEAWRSSPSTCGRPSTASSRLLTLPVPIDAGAYMAAADDSSPMRQRAAMSRKGRELVAALQNVAHHDDARRPWRRGSLVPSSAIWACTQPALDAHFSRRVELTSMAVAKEDTNVLGMTRDEARAAGTPSRVSSAPIRRVL